MQELHENDTEKSGANSSSAGGYIATILRAIPDVPQRQDSLVDQLRDVAAVANKMGCYDAADLISDVLSGRR